MANSGAVAGQGVFVAPTQGVGLGRRVGGLLRKQRGLPTLHLSRRERGRVSLFGAFNIQDVSIYSPYARGDELLVSAYNDLDLTPKGRNETGPSFDLTDWVRHRDRYSDGGFVDSTGRYQASEGWHFYGCRGAHSVRPTEIRPSFEEHPEHLPDGMPPVHGVAVKV